MPTCTHQDGPRMDFEYPAPEDLRDACADLLASLNTPDQTPRVPIRVQVEQTDGPRWAGSGTEYLLPAAAYGPLLALIGTLEAWRHPAELHPARGPQPDLFQR